MSGRCKPPRGKLQPLDACIEKPQRGAEGGDFTQFTTLGQGLFRLKNNGLRRVRQARLTAGDP
jgi:hypothetical protein